MLARDSHARRGSDESAGVKGRIGTKSRHTHNCMSCGYTVVDKVYSCSQVRIMLLLCT